MKERQEVMAARAFAVEMKAFLTRGGAGRSKCYKHRCTERAP
jgi:hypothetical protein